MTDQPLISALLPPSDVVNLEEESVSNGFLPDVRTGVALEHGILTLAGQARCFNFVLGGSNNSVTNWTRIPDGETFSLRFLLKPGARVVNVVLLFKDAGVLKEDGDNYELTVKIISNAVTSELTYGFDSTGLLTDFEQAVEKEFIFEPVGAHPNRLRNRDEDADLTISPNGANIDLFAVSVWQQHTGVIIQESP